MPETFSCPRSFGGRIQADEYYVQVRAFIEKLRPTTSQRHIATQLNAAHIRTPRGLLWDRQRLANFLRNTAV